MTPLAPSSEDTDRLHRDRDARRRAQRVFDQPLVLEAGAGTGKTATLVNRVLAWSLGPGWRRAEQRLADRPPDLDAPDDDPRRRTAAEVLRRIVAITFTEAAAAEMAERVVDALATVRDGETPVGFLPDDVEGPPDEERIRRAADLSGVADQLQVRTIHGFCRRLLADHPFEAGLHPQATVDADGSQVRQMVEEIVREALPTAYGDPGDEACLTLAGLGVGPRELAEATITLVAAGIEADDLDADPLASARVAAWRQRFVEALDTVLRLLERRLTGARRARNARRLADGIRRLLVHLDESADAPLDGLAAAIDERVPEALREHLAGWRRGRFNATERDHLGTDAEALRTAARHLMPRLAHARRLDPLRLDAGRRALAPLVDAVRRRMHREGVLGFDDLLRRAARLLASHPNVAARARGTIDQLLVDEFQDTDDRQCDLIRALALEGQPDRRPGLFVVGDPKQSIYGWRNADLAAYESFVEAILAAGGTRMPLVENFRSVPAVLDEVRRAVAPTMVRVPGVQPPFEPLVASARMRAIADETPDDDAAVEQWLSWRRDAEPPPARGTDAATASAIEARALVRDLRRWHARGVPWRDVGLLVRATTDIEVYLGALREADIPFAVSHDRQYYRRREIIEASAVVRAVLAPDDPLALLAFLRSIGVGVPDAALLPLWRHGLPTRLQALRTDAPAALDAIGHAIDRAARETPPVAGLEALADWPVLLRHAVATLGRLRRLFDEAPADVFVDQLRAGLAFEISEAARYLGSYRAANLDRFFTELREALETQTGDVHAVLRQLRHWQAGSVDREEAPPPDAGSDAVRVMTIHRAKGLQFDHVYLLQTHKAARQQAAPTVDVARHDGTLELTLFGAPSPAWDRVEARRQAVADAELVRTLYVALTRAARRLVVLGCRALEADDETPITTHAQLLDRRAGEGPQVDELLATADTRGAPWQGEDGVLWRLPDAERDGLDEAIVPALSDEALEVVALGPIAQQQAARRRQAEQRMARPLGSAASSLATKDEATAPAADRDRASFDPPTPAATAAATSEATMAPARRIALATGSLVHLVLERIDLSLPLGDALAAPLETLDHDVRGFARPEDAAAAVARARALLLALAAGALGARFDAVRGAIVARELPLIAAGDDAAGPIELETVPLGYVAGTVDMIYRDPAGMPVIVDYKTDPVTPEARDEDLARRYRAQTGLYAHALQRTLDLSTRPRAELWYLAGDRVVIVDDDA